MKNRNENRVRPRGAAVILAMLFFISAFHFTRPAMAAIPALAADFSQTMIPGVDKAIPRLSNNKQEDQVFLSWPMDRVGSASFTHGSYKLSYYIDANEKIEFTVRKNGDTADVWYDALSQDGVSHAPRGYEAHSNVNGHGLPHFVPIKTFLDDGYNTGDPAYQVKSDGMASPYPALKPHFIIRPDTGFSFRYDGAEIHFLWDSSEERMYYVTNNMVAGRIFNMTLDYTDDMSAPPDFSSSYNVDRLKVLTGVSTETFRAIPFANNFNTAEGFCLDHDPDLRMYAGYLEMGEGGTDTHPGAPENELILRFDVPKEYDEITKAFSKLPSGAMPAGIEMGSPDPKNEIQITVSDLRDSAPVSNINTTGGAVIKNAGWVDSAGERFEVRLGNMKPSVLFNRVNVSLTGGDIAADRTGIPIGRVFTFLHYEIVSQDGVFYALIKPYAGYSGYYMLKSGQPFRPAVTQYSDGTSTLMTPLTINAANQWEAYYQVIFSPEKKFTNDTSMNVYSQWLHYKADNGKLTVGAPNNFEIVKDYKLIPRSDSANGERADLQFTARWDIGRRQIIEALLDRGDPLEIHYRLDKSLTPNNDVPELFDVITMTITSSGGLSAQYSDAEGKVLGGGGPVPLKSRTDSGGGGAVYTYYAEAAFEAPAALTGANLPTGSKVDFFYPNIYFLNVKPVSVNGADVDITASLYDSMTLNDISKMEMPPPQDFTADEPVTSELPEEVSFKASFIAPGGQIADYISSQALYPDKNVTMNLYVCQNEGQMREQFMPLDFAGRKAASVDAPYNTSYGNTLYFSETNGQRPMAAAGYADAREALRDGMVVSVSNISLSSEALDSMLNGRSPFNVILRLSGMDKNQKYFLCADILLTEKDAAGVTRIEAASRPSNMAGITTKGDLETPAENEQIPSSPVLSKKDVGLSMATIMWDKIPPLSENVRIEYEIIRLKDKQMNPALLNSRLPFEGFYTDSLPADAEKAGWRTNLPDIEGYDGGVYTVLDESKAAYRSGLNSIEFTDYTLAPNQIYFYYARTVRVAGDKRIVSVWSRISVTSAPVDSPKNLRVEQGEEYDRTRETIFSFDAPIMDITLLGGLFDLQYQLKENGADWQVPVTMEPAALSASESAETGHRRFMYRLSGLKPGTLYSIRVRMIDANGDGSIYTNVVQTKTGIAQKDYENKHKSDEWIEYLKNLLKGLLKTDFWTTRNSGGTFEAVYRPDMFEGLIRSGAAPVLLAESDARRTVYYLPASAVYAANAAGKGIRVPHGDMEILLSPNAMDGNYNDAVRSAMDKIKTGHTADYYIKISVEWSSPRTYASVENLMANVMITAVGSLEDISEWNEKLLKKLAERVSDEATDEYTLDYINYGVERDYRPERFVRFMDRVEAAVKRELDQVAARDLEPTLRYAYPLTRVDEPIIIIAKNLDTRRDVHAYRYESAGWASRNVLNFGDDKALSENQPGVYVFSGRMTDMPGMAGAPSAGGKNAMIARYHLEDFFGSGSEASVSRLAAAGAAARIAGAPREAEPFAWLAGHMALAMSTYGPANPITRQEALHVLMNLYAYKMRTDLDEIVRRDFRIPADTERVKDEYLPALRAAYSIGLLKGGGFYPDALVTAGELLDALRRLDEMIGL
ncbi:MAG: fibronectin type III domain-containing protein [Clostridiales bacterium]|jgi:hypothetical protein|nr:fibronectin type III domain-containing protein [Clostridiales bacterium]